MECRGAKLQLWRQSGSNDLQEGLGLGWTEAAGWSKCGNETVDPENLVSPATLTECNGCILAVIEGGRCLVGAGK